MWGWRWVDGSVVGLGMVRLSTDVCLEGRQMFVIRAMCLASEWWGLIIITVSLTNLIMPLNDLWAARSPPNLAPNGHRLRPTG